MIQPPPSPQITRDHHYNPRMLLKRFTTVAGSNGPIYSFDAVHSSVRRTSVKGCAWDRDFYAVNIPGVRSDYVETYFGRIENIAGPILANMLESRTLPARNSESFVNLMVFLALMDLRGPTWRAKFKSMDEESASLSLRLAMSTRERWESVQRHMRESGFQRPEISYERMQRFFATEGFGIELANAGEMHTKRVVESLAWLPQKLARRNWGLRESATDAPDFVSSDCPVTVEWDDPSMNQFSPAGLAYRETEVALAVHPRFALIGRLESLREFMSISADDVAGINTRTAYHAARYVYSRNDDFETVGPNDRRESKQQWFERNRVASNEGE